MRRLMETAIILMGTLGFWGFVYPELCLTQETYECETEEEDDVAFWEKGGTIRIKSRALEYIYLIKEKTDTKKEK